MARPLKKVTGKLKSRNGSINTQTAALILEEAKESAKRQARKFSLFDFKSTYEKICSDVITALLTSDTFDPNMDEESIRRYIRTSAKTKAIDFYKKEDKYLTNFILTDFYIK